MSTRPTPAAPEPLRSGYDIIDHMSEVQVRLRAASLAALLGEAGRALAAIQLRGAGAPGAGEWRPVEVTAADSAGLLAEWLNELVYLAETERWVATEFELRTEGQGTLIGRARGVTLDRLSGLVKAATMHGLHVVEVPGGLVAEVILDV